LVTARKRDSVNEDFAVTTVIRAHPHTRMSAWFVNALARKFTDNVIMSLVVGVALTSVSLHAKTFNLPSWDKGDRI
jgi:hypothetical protein